MKKYGKDFGLETPTSNMIGFEINATKCLKQTRENREAIVDLKEPRVSVDRRQDERAVVVCWAEASNRKDTVVILLHEDGASVGVRQDWLGMKSSNYDFSSVLPEYIPCRIRGSCIPHERFEDTDVEPV